MSNPENPYRSPQAHEPAAAKPPAGGSVDIVLEMATAQRGMIWLLLAKLGVDMTANMVMNGVSEKAVLLTVAVVFLVVEVAIAYFVFRLANVIYGVGPAIVCVALTIIPCLGIFTVVILNGNVTDRLRKAGVKVGFMGATKMQMDELRAARQQRTV